MKIYIKSHAYKRSKVLDNLHYSAKPAIVHLIKIAMYPTSSAINHWKGEVYNALHHVDATKPRNRVPEAKDIFKYTWETNSDRVSAFVYGIIRDEGLDYSPSTSVVLEYVLKEYFLWLSQKLSVFGEVQRQDVYNTIDKIMSEYVKDYNPGGV